jgi:hypothetical protein
MIAMVLKSDIAFIRSGTTVGFKIKFARRDRLPFGVVCDFHSIHRYDGAGTFESDDHGVLLAGPFAWIGQCFGD